MGLEVISGYNKTKRVETDESAKSSDSVATVYLLNKTDALAVQLNEIQRQMDLIQRGLVAENSQMEYIKEQISETKKELSGKMFASAKMQVRHTEEAAQNLDASMDRLADRFTVRSIRKMMLAALSFSIVNLVVAAVMMLYLFGYLK